MPLYEYRCRTCDDTFEMRRAMSESNEPAPCPSGHTDSVRLLSVFASVGGTGRYLGARGEYTVVGSHTANGGDGSAIYRFTIHVDDHIDDHIDQTSGAPVADEGN